MLLATRRNALLFAGGCLLLTAILVGSEDDAGLAAGAGQLASHRNGLAANAAGQAAGPRPATWENEDAVPVDARAATAPRLVRAPAPEAGPPALPPPGTAAVPPAEGQRLASPALGFGHGDSGAGDLAQDLRRQLTNEEYGPLQHWMSITAPVVHSIRGA